jgi:hypothetical protein
MSFVYHMSNNFLTQLLDFFGMFLYVYLMIAINLRRLGWLSRAGGRVFYWVLTAASCAGIYGLYLARFQFQIVIGVLAAVIIFSELWIYLRKTARARTYVFFFPALLLIGIAEGFSLLDGSRTWCDPSHPFLHGHVLWHTIGAISTVFTFLHFRQIELDGKAEAAQPE